MFTSLNINLGTQKKNIMEKPDTQFPDAGQGEYQVTEIVIFFIKKHQNHRSEFFISCGACRVSTLRHQPDTNKTTEMPNTRYVCGLVKVSGVDNPLRWSYIIGETKKGKYYYYEGRTKASDGVDGEMQNLLDWDIVKGAEPEKNSFDKHNKEKDQRLYEGNSKCTLQ